MIIQKTVNNKDALSKKIFLSKNDNEIYLINSLSLIRIHVIAISIRKIILFIGFKLNLSSYRPIKKKLVINNINTINSLLFSKINIFSLKKHDVINSRRILITIINPPSNGIFFLCFLSFLSGKSYILKKLTIRL